MIRIDKKPKTFHNDNRFNNKAADVFRHQGYIKVDGVSSVFCFIWGWEEPTWGLPFQFHGVFYVMISMKGP